MIWKKTLTVDRDKQRKRIAVKLEKRARKARKSHLDFIMHTWQRRDPLIVGLHTREICAILDKAMEKYRNGISSFIDINVPFRHGKSDLVSRYLTPHFLGEFPNDEVMTISYGDDLSSTFSKFSRKVIQTPEFKQIYPEFELDRFNKSVHEWAVEGDTGKAQYSGVSGGLSGKGYNLGICDDLFKNREQADSDVYREKIWESYTNDFLSRRAPVSITINLNTRWHEDDHNGRITNKMESDKDFPRFQRHVYPALSDKYETGYLFPERFPAKWYREQKASLGEYGFNSLMQNDPTPRAGNQFRGLGCQVIEPEEVPEGLRWIRAWDLASSDKQMKKDDPDFTAGALMAVTRRETDIPEAPLYKIYIKHLAHGQWSAPLRNAKIINCASSDGIGTPIAVEAFGGYKDAYMILSDVLKGVRTVEKMQLAGNKSAKASILEPIYEAGNIYLVKADWNNALISEFKKFPGGSHDDIVDSVVVGFNKATNVVDLTPFDLPI